jgi:hypothetical protein
MRVWTRVGITIKKPDGGAISWPAEAGCVVDDALGQEWIDAEKAYPATDHNEPIIPKPVAESDEDEDGSAPGPSMGDFVEEDEDNG